jgi:hypothetical protein
MNNKISFMMTKKIYDIEADQIKEVEREGKRIQFIENPSEKVQLAAVNNDCEAIMFIENPNEDVQRIAVKKNINMINHIKNPTKYILDYVKRCMPEIRKPVKLSEVRKRLEQDRLEQERLRQEMLNDHNLIDFQCNGKNRISFNKNFDVVFSNDK